MHGERAIRKQFAIFREAEFPRLFATVPPPLPRLRHLTLTIARVKYTVAFDFIYISSSSRFTNVAPCSCVCRRILNRSAVISLRSDQIRRPR